MDGKNSHLRTMPTITEVFLHSLLLYRKSSSLQGLLESPPPPKKKMGVTMHYFKDN